MNCKHTPSRSRHQAAGFTLIEIMVVVLIIGLIMSVVVPNLDFIWGDQQKKKAEIDTKAIANAVQMYKMSKGKLPEELTVLQEKNDKGESMLSELPQDPWGNDYKLIVNNPTDWKVISWGPDGAEGGDDDIASKKEK